MNNHIEKEMEQLVEQAISGNKTSLETLLVGVQDLVFHLSLRMLGTVPDAEDAAQEILIKVMTNLSSFRKESRFTTWVFRIASNHLKNYKKHMFAEYPLSFEYYGEDIVNGMLDTDMSQGVDRALLEEELKLSCTNVMLQCLDGESRCIFILGTMFKVDSRVAADILDMTPEAYRQKLSRVRKKMAEFLREYCGQGGSSKCSCKRRVNYAISTHRLHPQNLEFSSLEKGESKIQQCLAVMEKIDDVSLLFSSLPVYKAPAKARAYLTELLNSDQFQLVCK